MRFFKPNIQKMEANKDVERLARVALNDKDETFRRTAVMALGTVGDGTAVAPLIRVLESDEAYGVRSAAAQTLQKLDSARAVDPLIRTLENDGDPSVREVAHRHDPPGVRPAR